MKTPKWVPSREEWPPHGVVIPPAASTPPGLVRVWKESWEKVWSPLTFRALERVSTPARFARPHILHYNRLNQPGEGEHPNPLGALALWLIPDPSEKLPRDLTPERVVPVMVVWEAILHLVMAQLGLQDLHIIPAALLTRNQTILTGKYASTHVWALSPLQWLEWQMDGFPAEVVSSRLLQLAIHILETVSGGYQPERRLKWVAEVSLLHPAVSMMVARTFEPRRRRPDPTFWVDQLTRAVVEDVGGANRVVVESRLTTVAHRRELEQQLRTWLGV